MKLSTRLRLRKAIFTPRRPSPVGIVLRGLAAGALGAAAQSLFFRATASLTPEPGKLSPGEGKPEAQAKGESSLETVARRFTEGMMKRGPLTKEEKRRAGQVVHYAFGAAWGAAYALVRESTRVSPALFGLAVWGASDNLLLPAFRLAAWPHRYRLAEHHYAVHAHLAYGYSTAAAYALLRDLGTVRLALLPAVAGFQLWAWLLRTPPGRLAARARSFPRRFAEPYLQKAALA